SWVVTCSNANAEAKLRCVMQQTLFVSGTGQRVLGVTIARDAQKPDVIAATVQSPHGINLAEGVSYWIDDGQPTKIPVSHADANGSYARFVIDRTLAASLRKGSVFRVATKPLAGEELIIELSLSGFSAAFDILAAN